MVNNTNEHMRKTPAKQGSEAVISRDGPNFPGKNVVFWRGIDLLSKVRHDFPLVAAQQEPPRVRPQGPLAEVIYQIIFMPN
jgi:hypothetical protein